MNRINKLLAIVAATVCMASCSLIAEDYKEYVANHSNEVVDIDPSGEVKPYNLEIDDFSHIDSRFGIISVEYSQSDAEPMAQLICNNEIMQIVDIYTKNGTLHIDPKDNIEENIRWNISNDYECRLICNSKQLKSIKQKGSGDVVLKNGITGDKLEIERSGLGDLECLQPLNVKKLHISSSGSGSTYMCGTFDRIEIKNSGLGNLNINGPLSTKYMSIESSGSGDMDITENIDIETLKLKSSGLGDIKMQGKIDDAAISMSGSGSMEIHQLEVKNLAIKKSGLGTISMSTLEAENVVLESSGSGSTSINSLKAESIDISCSGLGGMYIYEGTVGTATVNYSGNSWFNADGLDADNVKFNASGTGKHEIGTVKKSLDVTLRDKTSLTYSGNPASVKENIGKKAKLNKR